MGTPLDLDLFHEIESAHQRILLSVRETYLQFSDYYSQKMNANVFFKCENLQTTGSFKFRGAMSKFTSLSPEQQQSGLVAASTGNHGKAVAEVARRHHCQCTIFAPETAEDQKLKGIERLGVDVRRVGIDCVEAESAAREFALQNKCAYLSPYNDPMVVAGQGTIGLEISNQLDRVDAVIASIGGGGLIGGTGCYLSNKFPGCEVIGGSPENSNVMIQSMEKGEIVDVVSKDTLSDGTAGGVEAGSITLDICQKWVGDYASVSEQEIARCLVEFVNEHGMLIEGAAAVAIATMLKRRERLEGKNVVVVLCGGNIGCARLAETFAKVNYGSEKSDFVS